ncbi:hypothetical protein JCM10908_007327 [Rhodotorula pacifica]|uniref:uncharacterized protein n=1 Tax=Rhodotorula pacifica TaxID=1495444 RepID=UPI003172842F
MKRLFQRKDKHKHDHDPSPTQTSGGPLAPPVPIAAATPNPHAPPPGMVPVQGLQGAFVPRPPRVQDVGNAIGWSVAMNTFDYAYLLELADYLASSANASKEAAKALTKEFKHASPPAQERAVRLTGILFRNTDTRFRQQVAQKKFLAALTGLVSSPTSPPPVKLMVFRVLSPLAYETRNDSDLSSITHAYDSLLSDPKTRPTPETLGAEGYDPALFPPHGAPLDPDDPLLRPEALLANGTGGRARRPRPERFPTGLEQMQDLRKRAIEGRGYAAMLTDAVINAEEEEDKERRRRSAEGLPAVPLPTHGEDGQEREVRTGLEANEVVQEIHAKLLEVQDFLTSNLEWAAAQANQSRAKADAEVSSHQPSLPPAQQQPVVDPDVAANVRLASNNPFAAVLSGDVPLPPANGPTKTTTEEEDILSEILTATPEISEALESYATRLAHARERANEDAELATAMARSVADTRVDRYRLEQESRYRSDTMRTHDYMEGVSGDHPPAAMTAEEYERRQQEENDAADAAGDARAPYDSRAAFFGQPQSREAVPVSSASPYDGLEALAGLTFDPPSAAAAGNNGNSGLANSTVAEDPFFSSVASQTTPTSRPRSQEVPSRNAFAPTNPYASYANSSPARSYANYEPATDSIREGYEASHTSPLRPVGPTFDLQTGLRERSETDASMRSSFIPEAPSAKALGKLRRVSVGQSADEERARQQQEQLEEAMRERYRLNRETELQRREQQNNGGS